MVDDKNVRMTGDRSLPNLGIARPRKLTPLANRPPMLDVSAHAKESGSVIGTISTTRQGKNFGHNSNNVFTDICLWLS